MQKTIKKLLNFVLTMAILLNPLLVHAENMTGAVVINEIAWMGSTQNSTDEWIELYNRMDFEMDISGWTIMDDTTTEYLIESAIIPANSYFLIATNENAAGGVMPDLIVPLSLANSGDSLVLNDEFANQIDEVNLSGGAWYSGDNTQKLTMERLNPNVLSDIAENWANSKVVGGTPKALNQQEPDPTVLVELSIDNPDVKVGDTFTVSASIKDVKSLFSYGFDLSYDAEFLQYQTATEGAFLMQNANATTFQAGLENSQPGKLIVGGAIIEDGQTQGLDGNGTLFAATFTALAEGESDISFADNSFAGDFNKDLPVNFAGIGIGISAAGSGGGGEEPLSVENLSASLAENQFELALSWDDAGADTYKIFRKNVKGEFSELNEVNTNNFTDNKDIIPEHEYEYKVIPYKNGVAGAEALVNIMETRGLQGDNDRSNRVDGRDLSNLAKHFGEEIEIDETYDALIDSTYDGFIDGSDLIDIGANWAAVYTP